MAPQANHFIIVSLTAATNGSSNAKDRRLERFNTSVCLGLSVPNDNYRGAAWRQHCCMDSSHGLVGFLQFLANEVFYNFLLLLTVCIKIFNILVQYRHFSQGQGAE